MSNHDQRFKVLLREYFAEFLRLFFPTWADRLDLSSLEWLDKELFSDPPQGDSRELDLLVRLPATVVPLPILANQPGPWLVLVHLEVEATDSVASLHGRMFDYWWHLRIKYRLPVVPISLYLRVGFDGVGWSEYVETLWEQELVRFRYAYVGLPALDAFEYLRTGNMLAAGLAALMRVPPERRAELKAEAEQRVASSSENEFRKFLLDECIDAYLPLEGAQLEEYNQLLVSETYEEARTMVQTRYEQALETGIERGVERGIERGQRGLLLRQLEERFGPLSAEVRQRLDAWPAEQLPDLAVAVLTKESLRALGLE